MLQSKLNHANETIYTGDKHSMSIFLLNLC